MTQKPWLAIITISETKIVCNNDLYSNWTPFKFYVQQNPKIIMQFRSEKELLLLTENLNN